MLFRCCPQGLGLVFVAVYQKTLSLLYVDELLAMVKEAFADDYSPSNYSYDTFGTKFHKILRDCEARADAARRNAAAQVCRRAGAMHITMWRGLITGQFAGCQGITASRASL
jgi:hypothetical protein